MIKFLLFAAVLYAVAVLLAWLVSDGNEPIQAQMTWAWVPKKR